MLQELPPADAPADATARSPDRLAELTSFCDSLGTPAMVLEVDPEGEIRYFSLNEAHASKSGIDRATVRGKTPSDLFSPRMAETILRNYRQCVDSRQVYTYEKIIDMPAGFICWETSLTPVIERDRVIGMILIGIDITDRKSQDNLLIDALKQSSRINADMEALASTAAHDLRGPLRQSRLIYETVLDGFQDLGDQKKQLLETGLSVVDKALDQIDTVLKEIRQVSHSHHSVTQFNFGHLCGDIAAVLDPLKSKELTHSAGHVEAERIVMEICVRNLVDNAFKHTKSKVHIGLEAQDANLIVSVSDDGPGFDPTVLRPGQPLLTSGSADSLHGFGLAAVTQLLAARGGSLWLDTPVFGTGATVRFSIKGSVSP